MRWECSECGECVDRLHPPTLCPSCGIAGGIFVLAENEPDESDEHKHFWTRVGLEARGPLEPRWAR